MMLKRRLRRSFKAAQRGVTILVVLVLLSVMLLGGLALARMTEIGTLASGNSAFRDAAMQASEIGLNEVYAQVRLIGDENVAVGTWYRPSTMASDAHGLPVVDWDTLPEVVVGQYSVRYIADRVCEGALPVVDALRQCLVKQIPQTGSARFCDRPDPKDCELDPPTARQFRVTIRVTGPKNTQTWVQSMVTKG
jgi:type IV pilus assembly protein PilX